MEKKQLISIRLEHELLKKIDDLAAKHDYYTRTSIINNLLSAVLKCSTSGTLYKLLSEFYPYKKGYVVKFEIDEEVLKDRMR